MITRPGGYCPKCDTVYDRPHECVGIETNVYERRIWNEAIEAAAKLFCTDIDKIYIYSKIIELKK